MYVKMHILHYMIIINYSFDHLCLNAYITLYDYNQL